MKQQSAFWIRHAGLVFAVKTFVAAMLAFVIALLLDMPSPYWAMTSVYITSHPLVGATRSKAIYRIFGTLFGAAATVAVIPNLVNAPELLCLVIACWLGLCLYLSLIDGTPRSYLFMLAGYTVALIGFPSVAAPGTIFDTAVSRVEEITLGICCASLVSMLVLPRSASSALITRTDAWLADVLRLGQSVLTGSGQDRERELQRMRLAADAAEMETLATHVGYETAADARMVRGLTLLRLQMLAQLPLLASIEDRLLALGSAGRQLPSAISDICRRLANWLAAGGEDPAEADRLRADLDATEPRLDHGASWTEIMVAGLLIRLRELLDVVQDCRVIRKAMLEGRDPRGLALAVPREMRPSLVRHRDHGLALWAAAGAAGSVLACCAGWISTGWPDGASAALLAAVTASFFAAQDDPVPGIRAFFIMIVAVIVVSGFYTFVVMPRITTIEVLIAALMPAFVLFGYLATRPATARVGTFLAIMVSAVLNLQPFYSASFDSFVNSSIALLLGVAVTGIISGVARSLASEQAAQRLIKSNWRTLAVVAESKERKDPAAVAGIMLDRLGSLAARLAVIPASTRTDAANLRQLRVALNIIDLRRARAGLSSRTQALIDSMLGRLASNCRVHANRALPDDLVAELDTTIASTLQEPAGDARNNALMDLIGIRCGLFPEAPTYQPHEPDWGRLVA